jgi:hypothetical protein
MRGIFNYIIIKIKRNEPQVMRDLGRSLIKSHDYKTALSYYMDSLKSLSQTSLNNQNILTYYEIATDFVTIMLKLAGTDLNKNNNLKSHLDVFIEKIISDIKQYDDYQLKQKLSYFKFISSKVIKNIYFTDNKAANSGDIYKSLEDSLKLSKEVFSRLRELKNEQLIKAEKEFLSEICFEIGKYYENIEPQLEFAEKAYIESLNNDNVNEK